MPRLLDELRLFKDAEGEGMMGLPSSERTIVLSERWVHNWLKDAAKAYRLTSAWRLYDPDSSNIEFQQLVPANEEIEEAISDSRSLLDLHDNWDGEGAVGYSAETWERAVHLIRKFAQLSFHQGYFLARPTITPADSGSIDIHWKDRNRELLINIPADQDEPATYFGRTPTGEDSTRGKIGGEISRLDLVDWLGIEIS